MSKITTPLPKDVLYQVWLILTCIGILSVRDDASNNDDSEIYRENLSQKTQSK